MGTLNIFRSIFNQMQLCQNFGISGGLNPPPLGTPLNVDVQVLPCSQRTFYTQSERTNLHQQRNDVAGAGQSRVDGRYAIGFVLRQDFNAHRNQVWTELHFIGNSLRKQRLPGQVNSLKLSYFYSFLNDCKGRLEWSYTPARSPAVLYCIRWQHWLIVVHRRAEANGYYYVLTDVHKKKKERKKKRLDETYY